VRTPLASWANPNRSTKLGSVLKDCPTCGEQNPDRARFCLNCGSPVSPPDPVDVEALRLLARGEPKTIEDLLDLGRRVLADSSHLFEGHDHGQEARELMETCLHESLSVLPQTHMVSDRSRERYLALVARRAGGEPFPLLVGHVQFCGLELSVRHGEFVPRPSSELTVSRVLHRLKGTQRPVVVDLCTGIGPIAVAVAKQLPQAEVWGTDISDVALAQGRDNALRLSITNVRFQRGDLYGGLPNRIERAVDAVVGYIPYIPPAEIRDMPSETREYEPLYSLTDLSYDGFGLMRRAISESLQWLKPGGWLLLEIDEPTAPKLRQMCDRAGLEDMGTAADERKVTVVVEARRAPTA
jgi:release factor glutamine methyltransferase